MTEYTGTLLDIARLRTMPDFEEYTDAQLLGMRNISFALRDRRMLEIEACHRRIRQSRHKWIEEKDLPF